MSKPIPRVPVLIACTASAFLAGWLFNSYLAEDAPRTPVTTERAANAGVKGTSGLLDEYLEQKRKQEAARERATNEQDDPPSLEGWLRSGSAIGVPDKAEVDTGLASIPLPPIVPARHGVIQNMTGRPPVAPFQVITKPGGGYYGKLSDKLTGQDAVRFYVVGGRPLQIDVPLGTYRLKYAYGQDWRGYDHLFGPGDMTGVFEADDDFTFSEFGGQLSGYTVELIMQSGGNLSVDQIPLSEF